MARANENLAKGNYRVALIDLRNLIRDEPNNVTLRLHHADALLGTSDFPAAATELRRAKDLGAPEAEVAPRIMEALVGQADFAGALAVSSSPTLGPVAEQARVLRLRGEALAGLRRDVEAKQEFAAAIAKDPQDASARVGLAGVLERQQSAAAAKTELDEAVRRSPREYVVQIALGGWYARAGQMAPAREHFTKAVALARAKNEILRESAALAAQIDLMFAANDAAAAEESLERLAQIAPDRDPTYLLRARKAMNEKRWADAEVQLAKILSRNPKSPEANLLLGIVNTNRGNLGQAEEQLAVAVTGNPNDTLARKLLAEVQLRQAKSRDALRLVGDAANTTDSGLLSVGGWASMQAGDVAGAIAYFERGQQLAPSDGGRALDLATGYIAGKRAADAIPLLQRAEVPPALVFRRELLLVLALVEAGKLEEAKSESRQFAAARPGDADALLVAAKGLTISGDTATARQHLERATQLAPTVPATWIALGVLQSSQGDPAGAMRSFDQALQHDAKNVDALVGKARLALASGQRAVAMDLLERARSASATAIEPRVELARAYLVLGDRTRFEELLGELRRAAPDNFYVRALEAGRALMQGQASAAVEAYTSLVADYPRVVAFHSDLARAHLLAGQIPQARAAINAALALDPDHWPAHALVASIAIIDGDLAQAASSIARLRNIRSAPPALVPALSGDLAMRKSAFAAAANAYAQAATFEPSTGLALKEYSALRGAKSADRSRPLRSWLTQHPDDEAVRMTLAQELQLSGDPRGAAREYSEVLSRQPNHAVALNNLAWLKVDAGGIAEGLELAKRAHTLSPRSPEIADTYGWALIQSKKLDEALKVLSAAHTAAPDSLEIRYHLAIALAKSGRETEARPHLEAVVSDAEFSGSRDARSLLESLGNTSTH